MEGGAVGHNCIMVSPKDNPSQFGLIQFSGFRGEVLDVIFYQNMFTLHNQYKSVE
jgi:hypothetical protein